MQYFLRLVIGLIVFLACMVIIPLVFDLVGFTLPGALETVIRAVGVLLLLWYVAWGPDIPRRT